MNCYNCDPSMHSKPMLNVNYECNKCYIEQSVYSIDIKGDKLF